jgi:hypothetical protein
MLRRILGAIIYIYLIIKLSTFSLLKFYENQSSEEGTPMKE